MTWILQNSLFFADAGFGVLLIALALILLRPVEANKKRVHGLVLICIGTIALLIGYLGSYLTLSGMEVLIASGVSLIVTGCLKLIQWRIDIGKGTWRTVYLGVWVACGIGFMLILLSIIARNCVCG